MISDIQLQLQQAKDAWDSVTTLPDEFSSLGFPGLTKVDVSDALGGTIKMLEELSKKDDFKPSLISIFNLRQLISSLSTYAASHVPTNPAPHMPEFLRLVGVIGLGVRSWFEESDKSSKRVTAGLIERLAEATSMAEDAGKIREELRAYHEEITKWAEASSEQAAKLTKILNEATAISETINANSKSSENALDVAQDDVKKIRELTTELIILKKELVDNRSTQEAMFTQFEEYRDTINGLLGDANRTGMAASFRGRKLELKDPMMWWLILFISSIVGIVAMGVLYFAPILETGKLEQLPFRLAMVSPLIWLGWFSAKHYGYTARLREDYAFKEAAAMSFEGYKRETSESTVEMQEKLLDLAINNFSDNPIRIFSGTGNHASPLHEVLDKTPNYQTMLENFKDLVAKAKA
jgi:hypothetical protein